MNKWRLSAWALNFGAIGAFLIPIKKKVEFIENSGLAEIHALIYFVLFLAFFKADYGKRTTLILLGLQGAAIEFLQPLFGRGFSFFDILGNCAGVAIAYGVSLLVSRRSTSPARKTSE